VAKRDTQAGFTLQKRSGSPSKPSRKRIKRKNPRNQIMNLWAAPRVRRAPRVLPPRKPTLRAAKAFATVMVENMGPLREEDSDSDSELSH
jgi:hypothetical protein